MRFSLANVLIIAIVAGSTAQASTKLRDVHCGGRSWSRDQITRAIEQAKALRDSDYVYPRPFFNRDMKEKVLFNVEGQLWEFPLTDPPWTNGMLELMNFEKRL
ncbi:hypothetical protein PCL_08730 [Purpureocillium lilacinum]|uniref:Uncharacterized protein n=1 Tax=Purpureocillium lilacinum TaxID=33203 RepID=A0A2U3EG01_PURLI|nr:hypothetical protein PCL_08730 [Purpureocillium lilacinum]